MTTVTFEKICKNCDNNCGNFCNNNHQYLDCKDFIPMAELYELAHEVGYSGIEWVEPQEEPKPFLTNTGVKNCYTQKTFYKLNRKLSREEWQAVKKYFKYYNFDGLKGWATVKYYDVTRVLVSLKVPQYKELKEQIEFHEKERHLYDIDEFYEHDGLASNLKCELDKLIRAYLPSL